MKKHIVIDYNTLVNMSYSENEEVTFLNDILSMHGYIVKIEEKTKQKT